MNDNSVPGFTGSAARLFSVLSLAVEIGPLGFSSGNNSQKLSGNTPILPFSDPCHQPGSISDITSTTSSILKVSSSSAVAS